jgi:tetratricopeptide (TPR) repeat protein
MQELPSKVHKEIKRLSKRGDDFTKARKYPEAIEQYEQALALLPDDKRQWEAATWLNASIGDTYFRLQDLDKSFDHFIEAVQCAGGLGNPFVHLRLGQLYFENEYFDKAADELTRAYMGAGPEILDGEDPKYLKFLKTKIRI